MKKLDWPEFKNFWDTRNPTVLMVQDNSFYYLYINDKGFILGCDLDKNPSDEDYLSDFETNYLIKCNPPIIKDENNIEIVRLGAMAFKENYRLRMKGTSTIIEAGTIGELTYKVTENFAINGVQLFVNNHVFGDYANFKVIDKDNILGYGSNVVLDEFANHVWINPDTKGQQLYKCDYAAKLCEGLYLVIEYNSSGTVDVDLKALFFLHKII